MRERLQTTDYRLQTADRRLQTAARGTFRGNRRGVALIITIGLLAVLTLLAVAFAIAMRVESMAARNYVNLVRSKQLVHTGLQWAMDDVTRTCVGRTYPDWKLIPEPGVGGPTGPRDALASGWSGGALADVCDLMTGEATNTIPLALHPDALARNAHWRNVIVTNDGGIVQTNGRVAYLIVNTSGLLDANFIGGTPRVDSTTIGEIDPSYLFASAAAANTFVSNRTYIHKRYETLPEIYGVNPGIAIPSLAPVLFPYSFDPGPDVRLQNTNELGSITATLLPKFNINSITNCPSYWNMTSISAYASDPTFIAPTVGYFDRLREILTVSLPDINENPSLSPGAKTQKIRDVAWCVVNYLDPNRLQQNSETYPWRHTEGNDCTPMINEIQFEASGGPNQYRWRVEVWYPFAPTNVVSSDGFKLQIGIFSNNWQGTSIAPLPPVVMNSAWKRYEYDITGMQFGTPTEFLVFDTPPLAPPKTPAQPVSSSNAFWFLSRVVKVDGTTTNIVDEAMGYDKNDTQGGTLWRRALKIFDAAPVNYQINDPRINGQCRYWDPTVAGSGYPAGSRIGRKFTDMTYSTLDTYNHATLVTYYLTPKSQGIPVWYRNGTMRNIGEIGLVFRTNLDDEPPYDTAAYDDYAYWRTIDLMNRKEGAKLIDMLTVRAVNKSCQGRITINTRQKETLHSLIHNMRPSDTDGDGALDWGPFMGTLTPVSYAWITNLVGAVQARADSLGGCKQWQDLFDAGANQLIPDEPLDDGGPVARAMRKCITGIMSPGYKTNDVLQEAVGRGLIELLSFRQNMFTILVAAQSLGKNGTTVVGEQRAVITVVRDSYTGRYFERNTKWLSD